MGKPAALRETPLTVGRRRALGIRPRLRPIRKQLAALPLRKPAAEGKCPEFPCRRIAAFGQRYHTISLG